MYYFENFLHTATNLAKLSSNIHTKILPCTCTNLGIQKAREVQKKKELETMLKS